MCVYGVTVFVGVAYLKSLFSCGSLIYSGNYAQIVYGKVFRSSGSVGYLSYYTCHIIVVIDLKELVVRGYFKRLCHKGLVRELDRLSESFSCCNCTDYKILVLINVKIERIEVCGVFGYFDRGFCAVIVNEIHLHIVKRRLLTYEEARNIFNAYFNRSTYLYVIFYSSESVAYSKLLCSGSRRVKR